MSYGAINLYLEGMERKLSELSLKLRGFSASCRVENIHESLSCGIGIRKTANRASRINSCVRVHVLGQVLAFAMARSLHGWKWKERNLDLGIGTDAQGFHERAQTERVGRQTDQARPILEKDDHRGSAGSPLMDLCLLLLRNLGVRIRERGQEVLQHM